MCISPFTSGLKTRCSLHRLRPALLATFCLCHAHLALSQNTDNTPTVRLQGFGTLSATRTNTDSGQFIRDLSQPRGADSQWTHIIDSLLGVQANVKLGPKTEAVFQAVSRYHVSDNYDPELTWAFLRHDLSTDFSVRLGRLGTEFYMLGDSRLVGYSNVSVRPPADFYGSLLFSYYDGADVTATTPLGSGLLRSKLFAGHSPESAPFTSRFKWDLTGTQLVGGYLDYLNGAWQLRLGQAQAKFNQEQPIDDLLRASGNPLGGTSYLSLVPAMAMANRWSRFSSLGVVYDQGPLNLQFHVNQVKHESPAYEDSGAVHVLAAYRLGSVTPFVGLSRRLSESGTLPTSPIPGINGLTASIVSRSAMNQRSYTLGGRWDVHKNVALKGQLDVTHGEPESTFLFRNTKKPDWNGNMSVYSLALDFVF